MVDLAAKPFYLSAQDIAWVRQTIESMTLEEKVGQLFIGMNSGGDEAALKEVLDRYHLGGVRYNPADARHVRLQNELLQKNSKIPLIVASNVEGGGDGACTDGTRVGKPTKIGATGNVKYARKMGYISGKEAMAVGSTLSFAPVVDILHNWHNSVVATRCFSREAAVVRDNALAYLQGAHEAGLCCCAKHFPGDGMDDRDQHLSNSVNSAGCRQWEESYGLVYKALVDAGVEAIMAGHIMQPAWTRALNPGIQDKDIMPATLSPELLQGLLRGRLGFNGLIVTDASHMVGMTCRMPRRELVPAAIAAGCDMFLFFNDAEEDFSYMLEGCRSGVITPQRLQDALERILGLKAHMGLHRKPREKLVPPESALQAVRCPEHLAVAREVADHSITLVKNLQKEVLPITPQRYPRIRLVYVQALLAPGLGQALAQESVTPAQRMKQILEQRGFQVEIYRSPFEQAAADNAPDLMKVYTEGKSAVSEFAAQQDLVLTLGNIETHFQTVERVAWSMTKGGGQIPWYVHEVPVIVVSTSNPFFLADVPQAKTYINCYDAAPWTLEALVDKLMGKSPFTGTDPVDAFCGLWDTHL